MIGFSAFAIAALIAFTDASTTDLTIDIERLRSSKGVIHACLTQNHAHFPDCRADPGAFRQTVPAASPTIRFSSLAKGSYALTLFHDENNNQRLDTVLGIPREGFGFSRNPVIRFGAPRFEQVVIELKPGFTRQTVRMQYLL
jgi:uncharacterized protein (DUF2141 family)